MKKYMIPICMGAGAAIGLLIGVLVNFAWEIFTCAGGAFGIVIGAIIQLIWNQTLPDAYFAKKKKKTDMDKSLFAKEEVVKREEKTFGHTFYTKNVQEEEDDVPTTKPTKEELAAKAEYQRRLAQRQQWEELQAKRKKEAQSVVQPSPQPKQQLKPQPAPKKKVVIVEEDDD